MQKKLIEESGEMLDPAAADRQATPRAFRSFRRAPAAADCPLDVENCFQFVVMKFKKPLVHEEHSAQPPAPPASLTLARSN
jgi:hypothetical protein